MQLISVYLYPNKIDVFTNSIAASWKTERYRQVYQRNLKIYRGADNDIDIHVKSSDQKSQDITGHDLVFNIIGKDTQELILQKDCTVRSLTQGKVTVTITADELLDLQPGFYQYSVTKEVRSDVDSTEHTVSSREVLYLDSQYGTNGTLEVHGSVLGEVKSSLVIKAFREDIVQEGDTPTSYYSSIINADPNLSTPSTIHTFRFYMTDYNGEVVIQGSQSEGANPHIWEDLSTYEVVDSDLSYSNVIGKYYWFRIKHTPTSGTLDKILYR